MVTLKTLLLQSSLCGYTYKDAATVHGHVNNLERYKGMNVERYISTHKKYVVCGMYVRTHTVRTDKLSIEHTRLAFSLT